MEIFKNPIVIGITMGSLVYGYLTYTTNERNLENEKKKKHKRKEKESVNLLIPLVIFIISWFISYAYFEYNSEKSSDKSIFSDRKENSSFGIKNLPLQLNASPKFGFTKDVISETSDIQQFSLLNPGLVVPASLPDILLDVRG